jgi:alpha-D-ribose 1-methylphosphonate 5-triphosphate synthase subunit PhnG
MVTDTVVSDHAPRQLWLNILSRAPVDFLEKHLGSLAQGSHQWLRPAETGLVMVRARAGGTGQRFNFGEATVTRCVIRPDAALTGSRQVGVGYVLGCSHRQALLVALADALLQESDLHSRWYELLIAPLLHLQTQATLQQHVQTQSTRVEFFTVAREAGTDPSRQEDSL